MGSGDRIVIVILINKRIVENLNCVIDGLFFLSLISIFYLFLNLVNIVKGSKMKYN